MFQKHKSLSELEEENEQLDAELSVARKKAMLAEVSRKGGAGFWKRFSSDGSHKGINFHSIKEWLKTH